MKQKINSKNIKFFETSEHGGSYETYFKSSNQWYHISHDDGYITDMEKVSFGQMNKIISEAYLLRRDKIMVPKDFEMDYGTKLGNLSFSYSDGIEEEKPITYRQIARRYNKLKRELY